MAVTVSERSPTERGGSLKAQGEGWKQPSDVPASEPRRIPAARCRLASADRGTRMRLLAQVRVIFKGTLNEQPVPVKPDQPRMGLRMHRERLPRHRCPEGRICQDCLTPDEQN